MSDEKIIFGDFLTLFSKTIDEIRNVTHSVPAKIKIEDNFCNVLRNIYQCFILRDLLSVEILIKNELFISAAKIVRPMMEIAGITSYLYKLPHNEREEKSLSFMNFDGAIEKDGKINYDWLKINIRKSIKDILIEQSLDKKELLSLLFSTNTKQETKLSIYDFFSKIIHYNPKLLTNVTIINPDGKQSFSGYDKNIALISIYITISATTQFLTVFYQHQRRKNVGKFASIMKEFFSGFKKLFSDTEFRENFAKEVVGGVVAGDF